MTRYPKSGKGGKWTVVELKSIPASWKGDSVSDGGGLSGEVRVSLSNDVSVAFRYGFKLNGKKAWHYCGTFPTTDIASIRDVRSEAKKQIAEGIDPRAKKTADKIQAQATIDAVLVIDAKNKAENLTVRELFDAWIKDGVKRSDENSYIIRSFEKHALPTISAIPLRELSEHHLRGIYRDVISEGKQATAVELSKDIKQMLNWGEQRKPWRQLLIDGNPANLVEVGKLLSADYVKERDRVLSEAEITKLATIFETMTQIYSDVEVKSTAERPLKLNVQLAMWLCLSTLCRIGELLMTEWKHVDFDKRTWFIPKSNTKGERGKKQDQIVYLSDFALDKFKKLKALSGQNPWVFPSKDNKSYVSVKSASKLIGDRQIMFKRRSKKLQNRVENNSLVLGDTEWTPHDLRRTGATMMQSIKIPRDIINLCQNHVIGSKVDRHYLHYDYASEKKDAWHKLGDLLQKILTV